MKNWKNMSIGALALAMCGSMGTTRANASEILYDGVGFMQGTQSFTDSFNLSSPGTLTVTLANVAWPTQLASLDLLVSSSSGALGPGARCHQLDCYRDLQRDQRKRCGPVVRHGAGFIQRGRVRPGNPVFTF